MTIEQHKQDNSGAVSFSTENLTGASGDGNSLSQSDLQQGFSKLPAPPPVVRYMPQTFDDGENLVGDPFDRGGFAHRPMGNER